MVLRTIFAWILFFGQDLSEFVVQGPDGFVYSEWKYRVPGAFHCVFATVVAFAVILGVAHLWSVRVEPTIAKITGLLDKMVTGRLSVDYSIKLSERSGEKEGLLPIAKGRDGPKRTVTIWEGERDKPNGIRLVTS